MVLKWFQLKIAQEEMLLMECLDIHLLKSSRHTTVNSLNRIEAGMNKQKKEIKKKMLPKQI